MNSMYKQCMGACFYLVVSIPVVGSGGGTTTVGDAVVDGLTSSVKISISTGGVWME